MSFYHCDGRRVSLWYLSPVCMYIALYLISHGTEAIKQGKQW
jgi:hypothetical protein